MSDKKYIKKFWNEKPYHSLDYELKKTFGKKLYKLSLNGGMSCPNRDGTLDSRGCIFCSNGGSGDFAAPSNLSITDQIEKAKNLIIDKLPANMDIEYIAYFQAFTNTYAPIEYLEKIYNQAINHPDIVALSIATRPDCLSDKVLSLLKDLNTKKPVWIELGLQTIHKDTAKWMRRGYELPVFEDAVWRLHTIGITVIVHTILGLPNETKDDILKTMTYIGKLHDDGLVSGIKLQLLHILKGTELGQLYLENKLSYTLSMNDYIELIITCLEHLPKGLVIHRLTGDGPKKLLLAPLWSSNKKLVLNTLHRTMKELDSWQGKHYA
ncbi:MAG: TIGR01212 family radical SAM protein [Clostridiales bacterium]|nr:TIGR01212 family radical SAM protein [Clostridiales bacterium]